MGVAVECQNMLDFTQPYPDRRISRHCDGQWVFASHVESCCVQSFRVWVWSAGIVCIVSGPFPAYTFLWHTFTLNYAARFHTLISDVGRVVCQFELRHGQVGTYLPIYWWMVIPPLIANSHIIMMDFPIFIVRLAHPPCWAC
jgi:hypothetical protein